MSENEIVNMDLNLNPRSADTMLTYKDKNKLEIITAFVNTLNVSTEAKKEFLEEEKQEMIIHTLNSKLLRGASQGNVKEVKEALGQGAYVNCKTEFGNTPLILATVRRKFNVVKLLLSHPEIYIDAKNRYGDNALKIAEKNGDVQIINAIKHAKQQQTLAFFKLSKLHSR